MKNISKDERTARILQQWDALQADPKNTYLRPTAAMIRIAAEVGCSYPTVRSTLIYSGRYSAK